MKNKGISIIVVVVVILGISSCVAFSKINNENKGSNRGGPSIESNINDFQGEAASINSELEQIEIDEAEIEDSIEELESLEF